MDCGFLGERESEEEVAPVLVIRERRLKMTWAKLLPREGTEFPWIAREQRGHRSVWAQQNHAQVRHEPAIEALAREIAQARQEEARPSPERHQCGKASPMGSPNVQWDSWPARTLKAALEHRIGTRIPPDARMLCWLEDFAACLINRCEIGKRRMGERATHRCWNSR